MDKIPLIDIACLDPLGEDYSIFNEDIAKNLAHEFGEHLAKYGFLYIKGHGIEKAMVQKTFACSKTFFTEHDDIYTQFFRKSDLGYTNGQNEKFLKFKKKNSCNDIPDDLKHAYDFVIKSEEFEAMPENIKEKFHEIITKLKTLARFLVRLIGLALNRNMDDLVKGHQKLGLINENPSLFRTTYYPEMKKTPLPNQLRISEHTDFGTFTMLFQDNCGGLEALSPDGKTFIDVAPIEDTIVFNIGDLLALWSNNKLKSTIHRVRFTEKAVKEKLPRQSFAWFTYPDNNFQVQYKDKEGKICSQNVGEHRRKRYKETSFEY